MFDDLGGLFKEGVESITYSDESSFAKAVLFGRACGSFFAAVRLSSSGQLPESYTQLRVCIESALYAFNIHSDPSRGQVWLERHESETSRKTCVKIFRPSAILDELQKANLSLGRDLGRDYDGCIDFGAHPNERSVSTNLTLSNGKTSLRLLNTERGIFQACLLICTRCGINVIKIFDLIYPDQFKAINTQQRLRNVREQLTRIAPGPIYDLRDPTG